mmetsp:Transcript_30606/g.72839  ORF Transcript_30606/g.72839 Transcript_30606/m.72839 type:complete len:295 (-) Transcript_30606:7-891(-)
MFLAQMALIPRFVYPVPQTLIEWRSGMWIMKVGRPSVAPKSWLPLRLRDLRCWSMYSVLGSSPLKSLSSRSRSATLPARSQRTPSQRQLSAPLSLQIPVDPLREKCKFQSTKLFRAILTFSRSSPWAIVSLSARFSGLPTSDHWGGSPRKDRWRNALSTFFVTLAEMWCGRVEYLDSTTRSPSEFGIRRTQSSATTRPTMRSSCVSEVATRHLREHPRSLGPFSRSTPPAATEARRSSKLSFETPMTPALLSDGSASVDDDILACLRFLPWCVSAYPRVGSSCPCSNFQQGFNK